MVPRSAGESGGGLSFHPFPEPGTILPRRKPRVVAREPVHRLVVPASIRYRPPLTWSGESRPREPDRTRRLVAQASIVQIKTCALRLSELVDVAPRRAPAQAGAALDVPKPPVKAGDFGKTKASVGESCGEAGSPSPRRESWAVEAQDTRSCHQTWTVCHSGNGAGSRPSWNLRRCSLSSRQQEDMDPPRGMDRRKPVRSPKKRPVRVVVPIAVRFGCYPKGCFPAWNRTRLPGLIYPQGLVTL